MANNFQSSNEYVEYKGIRILVSTFNISQNLKKEALTNSWLNIDQDAIDVYAVGLQEVAFAADTIKGIDLKSEKEWLEVIANNLHSNVDYVKLRMARSVGVMVVVFIRKQLLDYVSDLSTSTPCTGIIGEIGQKGGIANRNAAIRFNLHQTSLCFINSHFSPHLSEIDARNLDFKEANKRTVFKVQDELFYIQDHDFVFWFGDFNYRANGLTANEVKDLLAKNDLKAVLKQDQLKEQQKLGKIFVNYNEALINFMPTYKYDFDTDDWDSSEKQRAPAWCDRILWSTKEPVKCLAYRSHPEIRFSDHKPVSALFSADIKVLKAKTSKKTLEDVILEKNKSDVLPQISIDKNKIDLGRLEYQNVIKESLTIENIGSTDIYFRTSAKNKEQLQNYLKLKPHKGVLLKGQKQVLDVEICIDEHSVSDMIKKEGLIDDVLVFHLNKLTELSVSLVGEYVLSSFGCSIECLINLNKPIKEYSASELRNLMEKYGESRNELYQNNSPLTKLDNPEKTIKIIETAVKNQEKTILHSLTVPKELILLVNLFLKTGLSVEGLFRKSSLNDDFPSILRTIDTFDSSKLESASAFSLSEAMLLFLDSLATPVIPFQHYQRAVDNATDFESCKQVTV